MPPYARLLQLRVEELDGAPLMVMPFHDDVIGRPGYLHGGAIAGLLEFAAFVIWSEHIEEVLNIEILFFDFIFFENPDEDIPEKLVKSIEAWE